LFIKKFYFPEVAREPRWQYDQLQPQGVVIMVVVAVVTAVNGKELIWNIAAFTVE
jgi:hypothetical protein